MASTYSLRFRLNYQAPGDNLNVWGTTLNVGVFQLLEDAIARRVALTVSGVVTLTSANGATDQARCAFLDVNAGTGGSIVIPSVEKVYLVNNGSTGNLVVTTGAGAVATLAPGEMNFVVCDAVNVKMLGVNGLSLKGYVDATAWTYNAGSLPAQAGAAGKFVKTDGATASWQQVQATDVANLTPTINASAIAFALAFGGS